MRERGIQVLSYQKPCYYYYYHLIIISIIYLFNLRSLTAVCLLNCQCPEDSYIIDGYPCDQTKTVRSTNSERGILFRLCHGPLHLTNFPELPIERSSVFATKSKRLVNFIIIVRGLPSHFMVSSCVREFLFSRLFIRNA